MGIPQERQAGKGTKECCREQGLSDGAFHKRRLICGSMEVSEVKGLKALKAANAKKHEDAAGTYARGGLAKGSAWKICCSSVQGG
ncbi:hypothetical protein AB838_11820 [Rhodobacteraceae bacterium (ex Bugula neritina AB1)]|nr:hypothetical protein AB838_11820 [Rhodobacteraceae bacterium (ex Bugula neritina AB1)]